MGVSWSGPDAGHVVLAVALPPRVIGALARIVSTTSRLARRGGGSVIGGRVALRVDPLSLVRLTAGRMVVLVSGTNGKTTTTRLLAEALRSRFRVVTNTSGANMPPGMVSALAADISAEVAVLEVDEAYLRTAVEQAAPVLVVLLNLSRDQLDRVGEVGLLARSWQEVLSRHEVQVVANADDPLVVSAAERAGNVVWVAAGLAWRGDAHGCTRCGRNLRWDGPDASWWCECGNRRPEVMWRLIGSDLVARDGSVLHLTLSLPGRANSANAAMALAAAACLDVSLGAAHQAMTAVGSVNGRYLAADVAGRNVRVLLAKNPAGWLETLGMLRAPPTPLLLALNGRVADGRDVSWVWDVPVEQLRDRPVVVCGERRLDLGVRLRHGGIPVSIARDALAGLGALPPGPVDLVANYTAFQDVWRKLSDAA